MSSYIASFILLACGPKAYTTLTPKNVECVEYFFACVDLHKSNREAALEYCASQTKAIFPRGKI